jgi:xylono-1,5-lactonase
MTSEVNCLCDARSHLGEGVFWHPVEASVYWVDILKSTLHRLATDGVRHSWQFPGALSAVVPCAGGELLATFRDGLYHLDLDAAAATPLLHLESALPGNRFNDGAMDTRGAFWFGSMDEGEQAQTGQFYRLSCEGELERLDHLGRFCITNGPAFSLDGSRVYFTDSVERRIYRAPLDAQGRPGTRETFVELGENDGHPDGMCTDTDGGVWVSHFGAGRVTRFSPDGRVDRILTVPAPNVTKCAFGGPDYATLYITTARKGLDEAQLERYPLSGALFAASVASHGAPTVLFDLATLRRRLPELVVE